DHRRAIEESGAVVTVVPHASRAGIRRGLEQARAGGAPVSIVHILCHGKLGDAGAHLVISDEEGSECDDVDPNALRLLLGPHADTVRLVVLCACHGGQAGALDSRLGSLAQTLHRGTLEQGGFEAVLASRFPLSIAGSKILTRALYPALLAEGLDAAVI